MGKHTRRAVSPLRSLCRCNCHVAEFRQITGTDECATCSACRAAWELERRQMESYMRYGRWPGDGEFILAV